ncbi:MAG: DUF2285 domain-containing protein [Pseudomonadota bacterium]
MQADTASEPDWRDAAAYAPLIDADRSLFAWEWLRRYPLYREAAGRALPAAPSGQPDRQARQFGLVAFEPPHVPVPEARPLWRSDAHPYVLRAQRVRAQNPADTFELDRLAHMARVIAGADSEHLLLSDGLHYIRLDGPQGAFTGGPVCLRYAIEGLRSAQAPILTLRRFLALSWTGRFSRSLHAREARSRRWILVLRTHDALSAGADQRRIAEVLLSRSVEEPCWRVRESSVRSQVQRLVRSARQMAAGGYRALLQ